MPLEIAVGDALIPGMLVVFVGSLLLLWLFDTLLGRYGLYRYVWHPSLFRIAMLGCLFGAAGLLLYP